MMWSPLQAGKGIYSLPIKGTLPDLLTDILKLRLDPFACSLAHNLEVAIISQTLPAPDAKLL